MVIICPILTAEAMRAAFNAAIEKERQIEMYKGIDDFASLESNFAEIVYSINNPDNMQNGIVKCRRNCGMFGKCHGYIMKDE